MLPDFVIAAAEEYSVVKKFIETKTKECNLETRICCDAVLLNYYRDLVNSRYTYYFMAMPKDIEEELKEANESIESERAVWPDETLKTEQDIINEFAEEAEKGKKQLDCIEPQIAILKGYIESFDLVKLYDTLREEASDITSKKLKNKEEREL